YHSTALIQTNNIGEGNIILAKSLLSPFVSIGRGNLIWNKVSIAHDNIIGDFNTISGMVAIAGDVRIKNNCFIGMGSVIRNGIYIDSYSLVGASAYVSADTSPYS